MTAWRVPSGDINSIRPGRTATYLDGGAPSASAGTGTRIHVVKRDERRTSMDISAATTTLAAGIVALVAPALMRAFKKYIPADYVGLTSLGVSVLLGVIAG